MDTISGLSLLPRTEWYTEGLELSKSVVYSNGLDYEHPTPSEEYLKAGQAAAELQIVKAGYRLANVLIEVYKHATPQKFLS